MHLFSPPSWSFRSLSPSISSSDASNPILTPSSSGSSTPRSTRSAGFDSTETLDTLAVDLNPALAQTEQTCVPSAGKTVLIRCVSDKRVVNALLEHEKTQTGWDNRVVVQPLGGTGCAYWTIVEKDGWLQFWNSGGRLSGPLGKGSHSADVQRTRSSYTVTPVEGSKGYVLQRLALDGVTLVALVALEDENGLTRLCEIGKKPSNGTVVEFVEVRK